jgi:hypothetical protein
MIKKIWNDSVGSKVIAFVIIGVGGFIVTLVYSLLTPKTVKESLKDIWEYSTTFEFRLVYVVGVLGLLWILIGVVSKLNKEYKIPVIVIDKEKERRKEFCDSNNKKTDDDNKLLFRFRTSISPSNKLPYITSLKGYCVRHNPPLEVNVRGCVVIGCENHNAIIDFSDIKRIVESHLVQEWEELNDR